MNEQSSQPDTYWWKIKILCSILLIAGMGLHFLTSWYGAFFNLPSAYGSALVVLGGVGFLYHYYLIQQKNQRIDVPQCLIINGGLFTYIRHPMYLFDAMMFLGFVLLAFNFLSVVVFVVAVVALIRQAGEEDRYLSGLYPQAHHHWVTSTRLLVPGLF